MLSALRRRRPPEARFPSLDEFGYAELHGGGTRVTIVPALGGKIASMVLAGREWLWKSDAVPYRLPAGEASYTETADTGGYDECFPTIAPCVLPSWIGRYGRLALPDHGELWSQRPSLEVVTAPEGHRATARWRGQRLPYDFTRTIVVGPDGVVTMRYELVNTGPERLPFVWSAHPLIPLTPTTRLDLPSGTRVRVAFERKVVLGGEGATHYWPELSFGERGLDLSRPGALVNRRFACRLFFFMTKGIAAVEEGDARLEVQFDPAEVPNLGLWINHHGWRPQHREERAPAHIGLWPCIGVPDSLSEALGKWEGAQWLDVGATRRWTLTWRGTRVWPSEAAGDGSRG